LGFLFCKLIFFEAHSLTTRITHTNTQHLPTNQQEEKERKKWHSHWVVSISILMMVV
jgi:hypothetical protein